MTTPPPAGDLLTAAGKLKADAAQARLVDEHLDGHERPYNRDDPTDPAVVADRCRLTAELLEAVAEYWSSKGGTVDGLRLLHRADVLAAAINHTGSQT